MLLVAAVDDFKLCENEECEFQFFELLRFYIALGTCYLLIPNLGSTEYNRFF